MKLVLASQNKGKLREFRSLFEQANLPWSEIELLSQDELDIQSEPEIASTFVENALAKTRHVAKLSSLPALGDDSGLVVPALSGEPGIYSSRYAGEAGNDAKNNAKLLKEMENISDRRAYFYCVITYMTHACDPAPIVCVGKWWGKIMDQPRGTEGFGYDPLFFIEEESCTSAELDRAKKNQISHRGLAMAAFLKEFSAQ